MDARSNAFSKAKQEIQNRKNQAEYKAQQRLETVYDEHADIREIAIQMGSLGEKLFSAHLTDNKDLINKLNSEMSALSKQTSALLKKYYGDEGYLEVNYHCKACKDTGYVNGSVCSCLKSLTDKTVAQSFEDFDAFKNCTFENFQIDFYSDEKREYMKNLLSDCISYCENFSSKSPSLLFIGSTGLGKTHLSMAMAKCVSQKGFYVIYGSAQNLLKSVEDDHFGRTDNNCLNELCDCDLLIFDDLGTEFNSSFYQSAIYNIINNRTMKKLPTVINTNLSLKDLQNNYDARITSRIIANFDGYIFSGPDIRLKLKKEGK